jgi:hypothetical protein
MTPFALDETSIALTAIAAAYPLKIKCYIKCVGEMGGFVSYSHIFSYNHLSFLL